jgi:hypothetical protein
VCPSEEAIWRGSSQALASMPCLEVVPALPASQRAGCSAAQGKAQRRMVVGEGVPARDGERGPPTEAALFAHLSKVDHIPMHVAGHSRMMASESDPLTPEEFASLLTVGNTCAVREPPAVIPAEHSARLIGLGYIADLAGRLRMTTPGRSRIAAGFRNRPPPLSDLATEEGSHLFMGCKTSGILS